MARHRDFQNLDYHDYDDDYYEEDIPFSPASVPMSPSLAQYIRRDDAQGRGFASFIPPSPLRMSHVEPPDIDNEPHFEMEAAAAAAAKATPEKAKVACVWGNQRPAWGGLTAPSKALFGHSPNTAANGASPLRRNRSDSEEKRSAAAIEALRKEKVAAAQSPSQPSQPAAAPSSVSVLGTIQTLANSLPQTSPSPHASSSGSAAVAAATSSSSSSSEASADRGANEAATPYALTAKQKKSRGEVLARHRSSQSKPGLNLVCIGHVDVGKSTMMGHLLYLMGRVDAKTIHKYEKESKQMGKSSFHFAWVVDNHEEERSRGVTVDVAVNYFETDTRTITVLDAPGHRDFIPNMISGAAQADAAVLVVPATKGEFEGGFCEDGQTKEHAILARSLGVSQLIVAVNKMDNINNDPTRFAQIEEEVRPFLKTAGFSPSAVTFVPVSGLTGDNIKELSPSSSLRAWYTGGTLLQAIDKLQIPQREADKPVRLSVTDVFKSMALGTTVAGKVETGTVVTKDKLMVLPQGEVVVVNKMQKNGCDIEVAVAGENVEIGLVGIADANSLQVGQVLCDPASPLPLVTRFRAKIISMNYKMPLLKGSQVIMYTNIANEPAHLCKLFGLLDKTTGKVTTKFPRAIPPNSSAEVQITTKRPICLELFRNFKEFGRFSLRSGGSTIAVGIVTKLYRD
mmetsp:Transcript_49010/g.96119  ORF Transcript_49010/g.96119 Transcript_49010/m.96119 type:complete len:682 (+) Transcript_49010:53-2098(+)|eukprot:CAMPEP_0175122722 /NCGR_PEP_ID=MMETSP0087-20121206/1866_1 /TAXON_ID=136419 /ORGANISM="Unknown Unknown, Strain D1" /LENGTH=681 /DNA_ID=CAMNT_0016404375 /DNA_START=44 /DNA_END=2089 /DNA_ORIENTATION=-